MCTEFGPPDKMITEGFRSVMRFCFICIFFPGSAPVVVVSFGPERERERDGVRESESQKKEKSKDERGSALGMRCNASEHDSDSECESDAHRRLTLQTHLG